MRDIDIPKQSIFNAAMIIAMSFRIWKMNFFKTFRYVNINWHKLLQHLNEKFNFFFFINCDRLSFVFNKHASGIFMKMNIFACVVLFFIPLYVHAKVIIVFLNFAWRPYIFVFLILMNSWIIIIEWTKKVIRAPAVHTLKLNLTQQAANTNSDKLVFV